MSVIFSEYDTPPQDLPESIDLAAGYFRIGFVVLQIPPEDIICQRVVNNDKEAVLRAQNEMFVKSGQARWDVTVRWKALQSETGDIYQQWEDLQNVIAMFQAAPFVEIESPHVRQIFAQKDPGMAGIRLAMALRQLRIDNDPDIVDGLNVTLSMTFFNYFPYSADFGYLDITGQKSVSAYQSPAFINYINTWKSKNLVCAKRTTVQADDPHAKDWKDQDPGVMNITWREYTTAFDGQAPTFSDTTVSNGDPTSPVAPNARQLSSSGAYDSLFNKYGNAFGVDPALAKAVCADESTFQPNVVNPNGKDISSANALQRINSDPDGGTGFCSSRKHIAIGLMQLDWPTAQTLAKKMGLQNLTPKQLLDPETNIRLGCKCISSKGITGLSNVWKYQGAYTSTAQAAAYKQKTGVTILSSDVYVANITKNYNQFTQGQSTPQQIAAAKTANASALNQAVSASHSQGPIDAAGDSMFTATLQQMTNNGWILDHRVDSCSFYYREHTLTLAPNPLLAKYDTCANDLQSGLFPQQMTILMVNNLAQIPLASYQYPTYQHVGPCSSMISVSFLSVGDTSEDDEPQHDGLAQLTTMSHMLEQQYLKMRTLFRRTSSIHRTQAVFVENQMLNMCGVYSLMLDQITNETIRDSSNMLSVQMTAGRYENVFEDLGPFRVSGISQAYQDTFNGIVMGSGSPLDTLSNPQEKNLLPNTLAFRQGYKNADAAYITSQILNTCKGKTDILGAMSSLPTVSMSQADKDALCSIADYSRNDDSAQPMLPDSYGPLPQTQTDSYLDAEYPGLQARVQSLKSGAQPTTADVVTLLSLVPSGDPKLGDLKKRLMSQLVPSGSEADSVIQQIYSAASPVLYSNNIAFAKEARTMEGSPLFSAQLAAAVPSTDPSKANPDHGAYRDMGLNPTYFNGKDFNPAMYFSDWSTVYNGITRNNLANSLKISQQAQTTLAGTPASAKASITMADSTNPIPGDVNSVMRQTNLSGYTMAEAFPTFKLFLMEENNQNVFYAFDNFFSYASVQDIEIIWKYNRPATMVLRMTNLAHLLNVKLFDDTTAGKREQWYQRNQIPMVGNPLPGGETITGQTGFGASAGKTMSNQPYMRIIDEREGRPGQEGTGKRVPLKYFPLQTGTKIQLRIGSKNDPDQLTVVFGGVVTEVEGNDIITITAQSFLSEMMSVPADQANHDSWLHLGTALASPFTILPGVHLSRGPAYGGFNIFGEAGDVGTVMTSMLKCSDAKHFGHWQLNMAQSPLLKGYTWCDVAGTLAGDVGATQLASIFRSAGDRCGENVLINSVVNYDGTRGDITGRTYLDQQGGNWTAYLRKFKYYIAPDCSLTLWELIQDVARRYPEYLLLEKPYGFPYSNESTVVFAHPLDWYYSRPELLGDSEQLRTKDPGGQQFKTWWNPTGLTLTQQAIKNITNKGISYVVDPAVISAMGADGQAFEQGLLKLAYGAITAADINDDSSVGDNIQALITNGSNLAGFLAEKFLNSPTDRLIRDELKAVYRAYAAIILGPNLSPSDRLQPVRQYHFIDHQSIIHNDMVLNGLVYNAVKIGNEAPVTASGTIPNQHLRVLDVTRLLNEPQKNVIDQGLKIQYAQSFLREELGKMYRGELILRGNPKIRPMDILVMTDASTGMTGPLEVEQVIHSFNLENGFITIVKPRCCTTVNEAASPVFWSAITRASSVACATVCGFSANHTSLAIASAAVGLGGAIGAGLLVSPIVAAVGTGLFTAAGVLVTGAGAAATVAATATTGAAVVGAAGGALGTAAMYTTMASFATAAAAASIVPIVAVVGVALIAIALGVLYFTNKTAHLNPMVISPVMRFGRPWVGGIEGYSITDLLGTIDEKIHQFLDDEIYPTVDLWNQVLNWKENIDIKQNGIPLANPNPAR